MKLSDRLEVKFRLDEKQKKALHKLNIFSVSDLLFHFPARYSDISEIKKIKDLIPGENATIYGKVSNLKTKKGYRSKIPIAEGQIEDLSGKIKITWFHQAYLAKMIHEGTYAKLTGKVINSKYGLYLANPEFEKMQTMPIDSHDSLFSAKQSLTKGLTKTMTNVDIGYPVYPETQGITSKWFYHAIEKIFREKSLENIIDYIPQNILKKYNLPSLSTALVWIHRPKNKKDREAARKRFAFEEVFCIQIARQQERKEYEQNFSYKLKIPKKDIDDFISRFPFTPTKSQINTIDTILDDFIKEKPMSRLVEGDVGSGKTFVAATISYVVIKNRPIGQDFGNIQVAYMAPTEVLAVQLFENFIKYFEHTGISIALITGSGCRKFPSKVATGRMFGKDMSKGANAFTSSNLPFQDGMRATADISFPNIFWTNISRAQLLKWIKNGEIPIVIGTHSLISKKVEFKNLGLVIIDEQHRFGTNQRMKLVKKDGHVPHYLSMTATPIPRTLALTIYGDLDLSIINEMPQGRKEVITEIVKENKRWEAYDKIKKELVSGRQLYIICPKIDDGNNEEERIKLDVKSVTTESKRLKKDIFQNYNIEIMHSKMSKQKKEKVMKDFSEKKIDILVSTSVIEVGVNIPNATVIIIEGAERFGLAQLHQLRGRVIRSTYQSYCYLFADAKTDKTIDRLRALTKATNGFELAELDLSLRGAGELGGIKQWGITDIGMEAIKNIKMVEAARSEAINLITEDRKLTNYPLLKQKVHEKTIGFHFE